MSRHRSDWKSNPFSSSECVYKIGMRTHWPSTSNSFYKKLREVPYIMKTKVNGSKLNTNPVQSEFVNLDF